MVVVYFWVANRSANPSVLDYIMVGAPLVTIWLGIVFRIGYSLDDELYGQTLQFVIISRTKAIVVLFGKTLAEVLYGIPAGIVSFVAIFLISRSFPEVANIGLLVFSLALVIIGITVTSLLIAPLMVLVGGRAGFFNGIMPFGIVLGGFLFPIERLPLVLEVAARMLPTSWAMKSVWLSIQGPESWWLVVSNLLIYILISIGWFSITYFLFALVERRIRVTGVLGRY